ncbi:MAG: acylneuraminate cytidylyltransferase family protein [Lachnospiraceae bacterium]|nr:acylneuraminate cytidylyltransferase family protein [Lachnospiraceae bacterium]
MNLLFTICGRAGSKGVHGKNMRDFCGIPLIWYTLSAISLYRERYASEKNYIQTAINTDSKDLIRLAEAVAEKMFVIDRTPELAGDKTPKVSVILDCLEKSEKACGVMFDIVVDLDITSPLRTVEDIHHAVAKKLACPAADVVFSVTPSRRNPYFNMVRKEGDFFVKAIPSNYTARQQAPLFYDMNASIYAYSSQALRKKDAETFFCDGSDVILMQDTGVLDIDSEEDYALMQVIAEYFYCTVPEYGEIREHAMRFQEGKF